MCKQKGQYILFVCVLAVLGVCMDSCACAYAHICTCVTSKNRNWMSVNWMSISRSARATILTSVAAALVFWCTKILKQPIYGVMNH